MSRDSIFIDTKQIDRLIIEFEGFEAQVGEALYHSVNRTLDQVVTQVGRIVPRAYAIKPSEVKDTFRGGIKRPSKYNPSASITSRGHTLSMAHFPHTPRVPPGPRRNYRVRVTIKRTEGRKTVSTYPRAFIAPTGAQSPDKVQFNVFKRTGVFAKATRGYYKRGIYAKSNKTREQITPIRTLSIPQMITNLGVSEQIQEFAQAKMGERMEHELIRRLTSIEKRVKGGSS